MADHWETNQHSQRHIEQNLEDTVEQVKRWNE